MGLNIRDIIPRKKFDLKVLRGKIVVVDAYNILYQFLSTIRQPDGTPLMDDKKKITSHLSGLFYRNVNLLADGIKPVYVFDGEPPELKYKIHEKRRGVRNVAEGKYEDAKKSDDLGMMKRYSSQLIRLNDEMIRSEE